MSKEAIDKFREAINQNTTWQEEVRQGTVENPIDGVEFAKEKGFEFTAEEYSSYLDESMDDELSEFELELVSGGAGGSA